MISTYNQYHLGDNLVHLNYLTKLKQPAIHYCPAYMHWQLKPVIEGSQVDLGDIEKMPPGAVNAWIGADNYFYSHPKQNDWVTFHLDWFDHLSKILGVENSIKTTNDLLFSYAALQEGEYEPFDILVINSVPLSGQLPCYRPEWFNDRVRDWKREGKKVITTYQTPLAPSTSSMGLSVTQIGQLSRFCKHIFGVATGPMWPTFNTFNLDTVETRTVFTSQELKLTLNTVCKTSFY